MFVWRYYYTIDVQNVNMSSAFLILHLQMLFSKQSWTIILIILSVLHFPKHFVGIKDHIYEVALTPVIQTRIFPMLLGAPQQMGHLALTGQGRDSPALKGAQKWGWQSPDTLPPTGLSPFPAPSLFGSGPPWLQHWNFRFKHFQILWLWNWP